MMIRSSKLQAHYADVVQQALFDIPNYGPTISRQARYQADVLLEQEKNCYKPWSAIKNPPTLRTPPTIFSFFSGTGFLDLGFEKSGFDIAYVNEYNPAFIEAYRYSRKMLNINPPNYTYYQGSATNLIQGQDKARLTDIVKDARKHNDSIGFIGGPPCPDFSVGGKNRGGEGKNGKLSATYIELVCQQKPDFFLFENVKGLWSTRKHRAFYEELKNKTHTDYVTIERINNALEFGVPQIRDRIVLIGFRKGFLADLGIKVEEIHFFPWNKYIKYPISRTLLLPWPSQDRFEEDSTLSFNYDVPIELTVEHWFKKNDVQNHPNADRYFQPRAALPRFQSIPEGDDSKKSFKRLHRWRYSPTACYGNNEVHLHPYKARRISAAEAMATQSLPKNFVLPPSMTLTDTFKTIGNGVPYLMAKALAETILYFLGGCNSETYCI
jgi:DNA (cytosine-5)-methyltransferase 1